MEQFLGLQTWGTDLILWVQQISSSPLDVFFRVITFLGNPEAYLVILTLIYWCVNKRWGIRLLLLVILSSWVNEAIKSLLRLPPPQPTPTRPLHGAPTPTMRSAESWRFFSWVPPLSEWGLLFLPFLP